MAASRLACALLVVMACGASLALHGCGAGTVESASATGDKTETLSSVESAQDELADGPSGDERERAAEAESKLESEPAPEAKLESEPEPLVPAELPAGAALTSEQIEQAGGVDAFFWAQEIPDEVFARMDGLSFGADCTVPREDLRYLRVLHADAEGATLVGELVVNRRVADEVVQIFRQLYDARYPIRRMRLVDDYGADDAASCADDNTSAFNFRQIAGSSTLSNHAYGLAIDINTYENPYYIVSTGHLWPPEAGRYLDRSLDEPYMIQPGDLCYTLFYQNGWSWGGNWGDPLDYQHFEKPQALYQD